ncbi:hypothetical protein [Frankia sp. Mgl5]|uniref:hypothetical protein n=1 Tax=Frankia sp. Mgl5 TaxID=2933793 RepID=UPI002010087F|nr:hypothetical protein [Frankia sp. Mgl5]
MRLAETSDYQNPDLAHHASGEALSLIYKNIYLNKSDGVVSRGNPVLQPRVTSVSPPEAPDQAVIEDCVDDRDWLNYRADGQRQDDETGGRRLTQALALEMAGAWKIDRLVVQTVGTC